MPGVHIAVHIAVPAVAGMGGITLFRAGMFRDNVRVLVRMADRRAELHPAAGFHQQGDYLSGQRKDTVTGGITLSHFAVPVIRVIQYVQRVSLVRIIPLQVFQRQGNLFILVGSMEIIFCVLGGFVAVYYCLVRLVV